MKAVGKILIFGGLIGVGFWLAKKFFSGSAYVPLDYKSTSLGDGIKYDSAGLNKIADRIKDFTNWKSYGMSENTGKSMDSSFTDYPLFASMVNGRLYMELPKSYVDTMLAEDRERYGARGTTKIITIKTK